MDSQKVEHWVEQTALRWVDTKEQRKAEKKDSLRVGWMADWTD